MRGKSTILINLLVLHSLLLLVSSKDFDFFYFVQQWPASLCDTTQSCCYPTTGKPEEDFGIHGLWPSYKTGEWPRYCKKKNSLDISKISNLMNRMEKDWPTLACPSADGMKFWDHEWVKHGTCSSLDQHTYFQATLDLKKKANLLQHLGNAGIHPGKFYNMEKIKKAIEEGIGHETFIECNVDPEGNRQVYQVYLCVDKSASNLIHCPIPPRVRSCGSSVEFPSFSSDAQLNDEL